MSLATLRLDGFSVRPASVEDLPAILEIERKAYPLPWTEKQFKEEFERPYSRFLVLTDDETDSQIAGYTVCWQMFDETHILNVTTNPEWRGLGIGTYFVRHIMGEAAKKDHKRVFLEVRKNNKAAVELYQKLGFFIDHIKPEFYSDKEDAYFMVRFVDRESQF